MTTMLAERVKPGERFVRSFSFTECEFRDDGPDGWVTFEGVASVVDAPYSVRDQFGLFTETIRAGAFDKTLKELTRRAAKAKNAGVDAHDDLTVDKPDAALFTNHDYRALPLATVSSGRLALAADPNLRVRAFLNPARPSVQEARHAVNDGDARQMSIGFTVPAAGDSWNADYTERSIGELKLHEASIVWRGANHHTSANVRAIDELLAAFSEGADVDLEEVRRAVAHLNHLLPTEPNPFALRDAADRAALERKIAARPGLYLG